MRCHNMLFTRKKKAAENGHVYSSLKSSRELVGINGSKKFWIFFFTAGFVFVWVFITLYSSPLSYINIEIASRRGTEPNATRYTIVFSMQVLGMSVDG